MRKTPRLRARAACAPAVSLPVLTAPAHAHEPRKGPNGGELVDAGAYHIEVIGRGSALEVLVSDATDKPLSAAGFKAMAIMVIDGPHAPHRSGAKPRRQEARRAAPLTISTVKRRGSADLARWQDRDGASTDDSRTQAGANAHDSYPVRRPRRRASRVGRLRLAQPGLGSCFALPAQWTNGLSARGPFRQPDAKAWWRAIAIRH